MTILFSEDWKNKNGKLRAMANYKTQNKSFLKMAKVLKMMGVENNTFMLSLYDTTLIDVDPYNLSKVNDPTGEIRKRVAIETSTNVWYYIREIIRIPTDGGESVPFKLNRANLALTWLYMNHINIFLVQPRQTGKAQPLFSKVLTPHGWVKMGDIKVNDKVITPDGNESSVINIYPQGKRRAFKIVFEDGRSAYADKNHLWKVITENTQNQSSTLNTSKISKLLNDNVSVYVPTINNSFGINKSSDKDLDHFKEFGKHIKRCLEMCPTQTLNNLNLSQHFDEIDILTLLHKPFDIRDVFIKNIIYYNGNFSKNSFDKMLSNLHDTVRSFLVEMIRSIGGIVNYELTNIKFLNVIKIKSITKSTMEECQCIEIDNPNHLYITDNYIVTHNTVGITAIQSWLFSFKKNTSIGSLVHDTTLLQDNVRHIKRMSTELPNYLYQKSQNDTDNKEGLSYSKLGNKYTPRVGRTDKIAAKKIGRGFTSANMHFDELPFIANILYTYPVIMGSTSAAIDLARKNGTPYCNAITTTAGDPNDPGGKFALEIINDAMKFSEKLYDCKNITDLTNCVLSNSANTRSPMVFCNFNHLQLGYTDQWLAERIESSRATPDVADREFRCIWKTSSRNPVVNPDIMKLIEQNKKYEPEFVERFNDYIIYWYVTKTEAEAYVNKPFIVGMDSSDVIGGDYTAFVGLDPTNLKVIFTFRCNVSTILQISMFITNFMLKYKHSILIPERKSSGPAIIDHVSDGLVRNGNNPFRRIFNYVVQNRDLEVYSKIDIDDLGLCKTPTHSKLGFMTDKSRRTLLLRDVLKTATDIAYDKIYDPNIINELAGLTKTDDNRIDHKVGQHDDTVISWLLACFLVLEGKNLHYYGLSSNVILSDVPRINGTTIDKTHINEQELLKQYIKELVYKRDSTNNPYIKDILQTKLNAVLDYVDADIMETPLTADALQNNFDKYQSVNVIQKNNPVNMWLNSMTSN